jgi:hypothetical protein
MAPEICVLEIKGLKSVDRDPLMAQVQRNSEQCRYSPCIRKGVVSGGGKGSGYPD